MRISEKNKIVITKIVYDLIKKLSIDRYPIHLAQVIHGLNHLEMNIELDTYSNYATFKNKSIEYVAGELFKSKFGAAVYIDGLELYIIFVNDTNQSVGRQNWTIAHELGHILLDHYKIMNDEILQRGRISKTRYLMLEKQADYFAKILLCNPFVLYACQLKDATAIKNICNISNQAARNRVSDLNLIEKNSKIPNEWDNLICEQFYNFIYRKHCLICNHFFANSYARFCPICGNENLVWEDSSFYYPPGYQEDEQGRCTRCPKCRNKEVAYGEKCSRCHSELINKCTYVEYDINGMQVDICNEIAPVNARYCMKCGSPTTFLKNFFLLPWNYR